MVLPSLANTAAGFHGAERSTVKIAVYNREAGAKAKLFRGAQNIDFGRRPQDDIPPVTQCQVQTSLGGGGQFSFALHVPNGIDPRRMIEPDAWVDISFCRFDTCWHVLRGMVEEVRVRRQVAGSGTAVVTAQVTGRSFQRAWETTQTLFNQLDMTELLAKVQYTVAPASGIINATPPRNVRAILFTYFRVIGTLDRANWALPPSMPGARGSLDEAVRFDDDLFDASTLQRATPTGNMFFPDANLWDLAGQQYGDLNFCELYTDLIPRSGMLSFLSDSQQENGLAPDKSTMAIVFRDKPFPRVDPQGLGKIGKAGAWFKLPLWQVDRSELVSSDLGVSSHEALNCFISVGSFGAETTAGFGAYKAPLWNLADMQRRGIRKLDATSPYDGLPRSVQMRARLARLKDWYCLGPELEQGSLELWRSYPQVRVGGRVRVRGNQPEEDFTAYVESVRHSWSAQAGARTSLDVTRGWRGTDDQLLARLATVSAQYGRAPSRPQ